MSVQRSSRARVISILVVLLIQCTAAKSWADEFWVAPSSQQDVGGLEIASNFVWPVTPIGGVRFAFAIPNNLLAFQSAKVVLIPHAPGGAASLNVIICGAQNSGAVTGACAGPVAQPFTGVANQLVEVDISAIVAPRVGTPGATYLAVLAYTTPTTATDHVVGLRFGYTPTPPSNVATLGANTFSGIQTAPGFIGDGTNVTGVNATLLDGLDSTAFAQTVHGHDVSQVTNAATLVTGNIFAGSQTINAGHLDLDNSTPATGVIKKNGVPFLHDFGTANTFLGANAGNLTTLANDNTAIGSEALTANTLGSFNTAAGSRALVSNTGGSFNTAIGFEALPANTGGALNTAVGYNALLSNTDGGTNMASGVGALLTNTSGSSNTGTGAFTLQSNSVGHRNTANGYNALAATTGSANVGVGASAGSLGTTGSRNIYLGADVFGVAGESNAMYLGLVGMQTKTVIAGVRGTAVAGGEMVVIDANGRLGSTPISGPGANTVGTAQVIDNSLTADDLAPNSVGNSEVSFNYAGSASKGGAASNLACVGCVDASEVSFAFAGLAGNTFAGTQTIDGANLDLDPSTGSAGNILKNGSRFLHNPGTDNTFLGVNAGIQISTGEDNIGVGVGTLGALNAGLRNIAMGNGAMAASTNSQDNVAIGANALGSLVSHLNNTAIGNGALALLTGTTAGSNTAVGAGALGSLTSGGGNTVVGSTAGSSLTNGTNNIYIDNAGGSAESLTIRIGDTQNRAFMSGIRGRTTAVADAIPVLIDSNGQLGTVSSSRRFKEDIHDMGGTSDRLFKLHPVTFRYTQAYANGSRPIQFGLIAEEVADVFPELAVRTPTGEVETVHYETLNVLLLNEVQKQQQRIETLEQQVRGLLERLER